MTVGIVMPVTIHDDYDVPLVVMMGVVVVLAAMTHVDCDSHAGGDDHEYIDAMMLPMAMSVVLECSSSARGTPQIPDMSAPGTCVMPSSLWTLPSCHFLI